MSILLQRIKATWPRLVHAPAPTPHTEIEVVNERYVMELPSQQNAIDIFKGRWISGLPMPHVSGGRIPLFIDQRIEWLIERCGGTLASMTVSELGPFEGGHSYMLLAAGADSVQAIEANTLNYVKTLIVKEVYGLDRLQLLCGEIEGWLATTDSTFDLMVASGVLYHFNDPLYALRNMTKKASRIFLWTHFMDDTLMPASDKRRTCFTGDVQERTIDGVTAHYYKRPYGGAETNAAFCGGVSDKAIWISRSVIVDGLRHWGYKVEEAMLDPDHASGPCACFLATRT